MSWLLGLFSGPSKAWAYGTAAAILIGMGSWAGWSARDYLAERKANKELEQKLAAQTRIAVEWAISSKDFEARMDAQNIKAAGLAAQRAAADARASQLAQQVQSYKALLTTMEKPDVESGGMCERTSECHWLLLNAAYAGTDAPPQCTGGVPDAVSR